MSLSLKPPHSPPPPRLSQNTGFVFPASHSEFPLVTYFTYGNVYISVLLSQIIHLLPRLCPQVCLFQHLHCCPVDRFISNIFLDSIYVLIYSIFHSFFQILFPFRSLQSILLLGGSVGKESACSAGDLGSIPVSGRSPGGGSGNPLQYSCL